MAGFLMGFAASQLASGNGLFGNKKSPSDSDFDVVETKTTVKKRKFKGQVKKKGSPLGFGDFSNIGF